MRLTIISGYWDNEEDVYKGELPVIIFGDHTRIFKFIDFPFVCGADGAKVLIPNSEYYDPLFLFYCFLTLKIPNRGYNRHFSLLKEKYIPLPPLPIQQKIAQILKAVDEKIEAEEKKKDALQTFFKTMLHYLMTGKIRVKTLDF
jgi:type I restriction enzyme S subunit